MFLTRYLDLFTDFISVYNTAMKLVFIGSSLAIVWCMRMHRTVKRSYDRPLDTFRHYFLVAACFLLALLVHEKFTFQEVTLSSRFLVLPDGIRHCFLSFFFPFLCDQTSYKTYYSAFVAFQSTRVRGPCNRGLFCYRFPQFILNLAYAMTPLLRLTVCCALLTCLIIGFPFFFLLIKKKKIYASSLLS